MQGGNTMADLVRWDPFQEMTSLRDAMNQLLAESFVRPSSRAGMFQPPVDLYETENEYGVKLAAPGLKPDNFEITMQQNMLTIQGRTQQEEEKQEDALPRQGAALRRVLAHRAVPQPGGCR